MGKIEISDKIDVIIPAHEKDIKTLPYCIARAKKCVDNIGRVFVVSRERLVDTAEWIPESEFPFSKKDIEKKIKSGAYREIGWSYQQLLKFYAPFVLKDISKNVLILDSDTIFYKKNKFFDKKNKVFYFNLDKDRDLESKYFYIQSREFVKRMLPSLNLDLVKEDGKWISGVTHHMIFNKSILRNMMKDIENSYNKSAKNKKKFWEIFMDCVEQDKSIPSEYELYFAFMLNNYPKNTKKRRLKYKNTSNLNVRKYLIDILRKKYDYCSYHKRENISE